MDEMQDQGAVVPPERAGNWWWPPEPLTWAMWGLVALNGVILWFAYHGTFERDVGNDPAGAGMATAFREIFALAGVIGIGVLALLYLVIRHWGVRVALLILFVPATWLTAMLIQ